MQKTTKVPVRRKTATPSLKRQVQQFMLDVHVGPYLSSVAPSSLSHGSKPAYAFVAKLCASAKAARKHAQAPYSNFHVGAALLCADGTIIQGVNVESSSYGLTICAERSGLVSALSQGKRQILAVAVDADTESAIGPCGACRQLLFDYCPDALVIMMSRSGNHLVCTVRDLLPAAFDANALERY